MADKPVYIHYGADHFDMDKFNDIKAMHHDCLWKNKPNYGLWASRIDDKFAWKEWCEAEDYHTERLEKSFTFTLKDEAKILTVTCLDDVDDYIRKTPISVSIYGMRLDIDKIMQEYDGIELIHGDNYMELHDSLFCSWDVDSIVIWDPQILQMV